MELRIASYSLITAGVGKWERARVLCDVDFEARGAETDNRDESGGLLVEWKSGRDAADGMLTFWLP